MSPWFIFALLSMTAEAGNELFQKISLTQKINLSAITNNFVIWTLQGVFGLIIALALNQTDFNFSSENLISLLLISIVYFLGGTFYYTSFKTNSPSLSILLANVSIVVSTILGFIFFQEQIGLSKVAGISLIIVAVILVHFHLKDKFSRSNLFALFGGLCFGIAFTMDKFFAIQSSPIFYVSILSFSVALVSLVAKARHITGEISQLKTSNYYPMLTVACFGTMFNFFMFTSYAAGGHVGIVDAINKTSVFLVIALEIIILKDRSSLLRKVVGAVIAVSGISLLASLS